MKKTALIFLLAIFVPALILGGIALRTASSQRVIIEQQEAGLRQQETDAVAALVRAAILTRHQEFVQQVNQLLGKEDPGTLAREFSEVLPEKWRPEAVGFAVKSDGTIYSPLEASGKSGKFLRDNRLFLGNELAVEVYQTTGGLLAQWNESKEKQEFYNRSKDSTNQEQSKVLSRNREDDLKAAEESPAKARGGAAAPAAVMKEEGEAAGMAQTAQKKPDANELKPTASVSRRAEAKPALRKVAPQQNAYTPEAPQASLLNVQLSDFQQIVSSQTEGILARFVQDELEILFWTRPPAAPGYVFGAGLIPADLRSLLEPLVQSEPGACVAILDDRARPFASSVAGFKTDWKRPFVATEIGEALPHWEVALYLLDPDQLRRSAQLVNYTLAALIALALAAIFWGGYMVVGETRKQMALVQKKTDFVSNVSHELKTPLTSIRMFAELLHENRVTDPEKRSKYLRVITLEADRLTRLINNVLDFATLERNQKRYHKRLVDLYAVIRKLWEAQEMHLQSEGFATAWHAAPPPYMVVADEDAIAQVVVNLLSNAEKYSTDRKEIELHSYIIDGMVVVSVLDRGLGVPGDQFEKIFESFYRAHDSLSSGIQGSGLGLTLARRIAREHGGDVTYEPRTGGGSSFTLKIPAQKEEIIP